jgi:hypothetical protein
LTKHDKIKTIAGIFQTDKKTIEGFQSILSMLAADLDRETFNKITDALNERIIPRVLEDIYNIYDSSLDDQTLDAMLAFYSSEVGKNLLAKAEEVSAKILAMNNDWQKLMTDVFNEIGVAE